MIRNVDTVRWGKRYLETGLRVIDAGCGLGSIMLGVAERVSLGVVSGVDTTHERLSSPDIPPTHGMSPQFVGSCKWYQVLTLRRQGGPMATPCTSSPLSFHSMGRREGRFNAGHLTSEAGGS